MHRLAALMGLLVPAGALAQGSSPSWTIHTGPAQSLKVLGSEDHRTGWVIGVQRVIPEKRLTSDFGRGSFVFEGYAMFSSGGVFDFPQDRTSHYGVLALARWEKPGSRISWFLEVGLGLQASSQTTHDLNLPVNFTPTGGIGAALRQRNGTIQLTLRGMHISNAGIQAPNKGQNMLQLLLGWRF